ncbi:TonB-dependent receptor [Wenzhouxiangella sp. AB-CW3]|uniref:TonB-dependent receptor domain-containing protein n=1 Tax=Wenzhouxiangella sp. AB-CW3 TaxID=2771012 RepID=UPI00168C03A1|nr:TonB-dependent receptor [Wenzhouxiangella sp. AB-CW3]QOC22211.1 TonB-dependent receptor [Wenzhouxiangella sp. AB-CW3]
MKRSTFAGLAGSGLLLTSLHVVAEDAEHDTVVVTATRSEQLIEQPLASVSVIDRAAIERSQAPDILELLRLEAGIDMSRAGGPGGQTSTFMRGTNSNHVLVLIDGVRAASSGTGSFTWEILDPSHIERIEIVRGPRAARYGSDAIGGVIQIFTRQPEGTSVRAAYGRYNDRALSASWGSEAFGMSLAGRRVDGFSAQNERGFAFDPDDDGFENLSLNLRGSNDLGPGQLSWSARASDGEIEFDQGESDFLNYAIQTEYRHDGNGPWQWQGQVAMYRDRLDTETPFGFSEAVTRRVQAGVQAERLIEEYTLWLIGLDSWRESGVSRNSWAENRYNVGAWTGLHAHRDRTDWEASLRVDEDEQFGSAVTGNLAGGWRPSDAVRLYASAGRGFRAPNFNQLYSPGSGGLFAGNPELDPESSWTYEVGSEIRPTDGQTVTLNLFETRIDDLIDFSGPEFQAVNVDRARIRGVELRHQLSLDAWRTEASYTWQDPEDRDTGQQLLRRAEHKAAVSVDRLLATGGWLGGEIVHTGERLDVGAERLPSHTLVNLRAGYPLGSGFQVEGRLENVTDKNYEPLFGFNAHGRSLFMALRWEG